MARGAGHWALGVLGDFFRDGFGLRVTGFVSLGIPLGSFWENTDLGNDFWRVVLFDVNCIVERIRVYHQTLSLVTLAIVIN